MNKRPPTEVLDKRFQETRKFLKIYFPEHKILGFTKNTRGRDLLNLECKNGHTIRSNMLRILRRNGADCFKCALNNRKTGHKEKVDKIIQTAFKTLRKDLILTSNFVNTNKSISGVCLTHEKEFKFLPYEIGRFARYNSHKSEDEKFYVDSDKIKSLLACSVCSNESRSKNHSFSDQEINSFLKKNHGDSISIVERFGRGVLSKAKFQCSKGHNWITTVDSLIREKKFSSCPACENSKQFSKASVIWLNQIAKELGLNPKHILSMQNKGEYTIPGTKWKVDGFHSETNTIFEFHGNYWHGHPLLYPKKVTKFLATIKKEIVLRLLGYNLITVWQSDFDNGLCMSRFNEEFYSEWLKPFYKMTED